MGPKRPQGTATSAAGSGGKKKKKKTAVKRTAKGKK